VKTWYFTQNFKIPSSHTIHTKAYSLRSRAKSESSTPVIWLQDNVLLKKMLEFAEEHNPFSEPEYAPGDISAVPSLHNSKFYIILKRNC